jgi:hypothetical protein
MPFYADTRCSPIRYQFNVCIVIELLEGLIDKFYDPEKEDKKKIELYVEWCENNYDGYSLDEWLLENYCEYTYWEEIEEMFSTEPEEEFACDSCDYSLTGAEFRLGRGRVMFNDIDEEGDTYRCGVCDERGTDEE